MMAGIKKVVALSLCILLVLSVILSVSFVSHGSSHCCVEEDCRICAMIQRCTQMLEELLVAASFAAFLGAVTLTVFFIFEIVGESIASVTPVRLKVKLSN